MSKQKLTYKKMLGYLKNVFSNKERHALEKEVMQDPFEAEAYEGLSELSAEALESDMKKLQSQLDKRTQKRKGLFVFQRYAIAASLLFLVGLGIIMMMQNRAEPYQIVTNEEQIEEAVVVNDSQTDQESEAHELFEEPDIDFSKREETVVAYEAVEADIYEEKEAASNINSTVEEPSYSRKLPPKPNTESLGNIVKQTRVEEEAVPTKVATAEEISQKKARLLDIETDNNITLSKEQETLADVSVEEFETWSGTITDNYGMPLSGVSVIIKDNNEGTVTDFDGNYTLKVPKGAEVEANYLGFENTAIAYESHKEVVMDDDTAALGEVVVVGYGTRKKAKESGVNRKMETKSLPAARVEEALSGRVAGVKISQADEAPSDQLAIPAKPNQGSEEAFKKWVIAHLDAQEFEKGKQYRFAISFEVAINGVLRNVEVLSQTEKNSRKHVKKIVASSENWQPAFENGQAIKSNIEFTLDVVF